MDLPFRKLIDMPPLWLVLFVAIALAQSVWLPLLPAGPVARGLGAVVIAVGVVIFVAASVQFRKHATTIVPHHDPAAIITSGVYGLSRNPIYLADALVLAGFALRWDLAGLVLVPVFMAVIARRFIAPEEDRLRRLFPAEFAAWSARTRRWVSLTLSHEWRL